LELLLCVYGFVFVETENCVVLSKYADAVGYIGGHYEYPIEICLVDVFLLWVVCGDELEILWRAVEKVDKVIVDDARVPLCVATDVK